MSDLYITRRGRIEILKKEIADLKTLFYETKDQQIKDELVLKMIARQEEVERLEKEHQELKARMTDETHRNEMD